MLEDSSNDTVEVIYATADNQHIVRVPRTQGLTAGEAAERSGLIASNPEVGARSYVLGIFGMQIQPSYVLEAGDRVEILRPLQTDPRQMRHALVAAGRVMGGAEKLASARAKKTGRE